METYDAAHLRDVSIPLDQISRRGMIISLALMVVTLLPHLLIRGFDPEFRAGEYLAGFILVFVLLIAHEATHALGWIIFGGVPIRKIRFGFALKTLTPYAHAQVAMPATGYRIGTLLPGIVTGLLPVIIGTIINQAWITAAGAFLTSGAVGDLLVLYVIRNIPGTALVIDHPTNAGCYVVDKSATS